MRSRNRRRSDSIVIGAIALISLVLLIGAAVLEKRRQQTTPQNRVAAAPTPPAPSCPPPPPPLIRLVPVPVQPVRMKISGELVTHSDLPTGIGKEAALTADNTVVVRIPSTRPTGGANDGSGFLVQPGIIVTAAHGLEEADVTRIDVRCNGRKRKGTLLAADHIRDLAVIAADCPGATRIIDTRPLRDNEPVYVAGFNFRYELFGEARRFIVQTSVLTKDRLLPDRRLMPPMVALRLEAGQRLGFPPMVALGTVLEHGNSGSVVFDARGRILGMGAIKGKDTSYMVPATWIVAVTGKFRMEKR